MKYNTERGYIDSTRLENYEEARKMAEKLHPNWGACSRGAKALHTRNVYQILGHSLNHQSIFVLCYARPACAGEVHGGTATAVRLASSLGSPIVNLWHDIDREKIREYLNV